MPHDNWLDPQLVEIWPLLKEVYGEEFDELLRQYAVMAEQCKLALKDIEAAGFQRETSFVEGDACASAFREGQRQMALRIGALANLTDQQRQQMEDFYARRRSHKPEPGQPEPIEPRRRGRRRSEGAGADEG